MSLRLAAFFIPLLLPVISLAAPVSYFFNFGSQALNQTGAPVSATSLPATGASYHLAVGSEFTIVPGSCDPSGCSVTFTPHAPGMRKDALLIFDSNGVLLKTKWLYGIGLGPLPVFSPGIVSTVYTPAAADADGAWGIAKDFAGNLYFSIPSANTVKKMDSQGNVTLVAGTGVAGFAGDGAAATSAQLNGPKGLAVDGAGSLLIADSLNHRIRKVDASGIITTFAGTGTPGYSNGIATASALNTPTAVLSDWQGSAFIADSGNNVVRKVNVLGTISLFAGLPSNSTYSGDNSIAVEAAIGDPMALAKDAAGNVYITDSLHAVIRKVNPSGLITTFAGTGVDGYSGNAGPATSAKIGASYGMTLDPAGNLYLADTTNQMIRQINTLGVIQRLAGSGTNAASGDGGPSILANFSNPSGIVMEDDGSLYVAGGSIRKITPQSSLAFSFANTTVGNITSPNYAYLFNIGTSNLSLSGLVIDGDFAPDTANTCSPAIPLTNSPQGCVIAVDFTPTQDGIRTGAVNLTGGFQIALTGTGVGSGPVTFPTIPLNFGSVLVASPSAPQTIPFNNLNDGTLNFSSAVLSGPNAADFSLLNSCPAVIAGGVTCPIAVTFQPSAVIMETAVLTITYVDTFTNLPVVRTIALQGWGLGASSPTGVSTPLFFVPVTPCRVTDTRLGNGTLLANTPRDFVIGGASTCGVPANATAFAVNITAVSQWEQSTFIRAWAAGQPMPFSSISNVDNSSAMAHESIVRAGTNGAITLFATDDLQIVLDVTGYYIPDSSQSTFHPVSACRAVDTRVANGSLGSPALVAGATRNFNLSGICGLPANASSYVLNMTAVPDQNLDYLQAWSASQPQPATSILNSYSGMTVANAAIVSPSADGQISVFATDNTDLVIDVAGYYSADDSGLSLYLVPPCRVFDTRTTTGANAFANMTAIPILNSTCDGNISSTAQAYLLNAAVLPQQSQLGFLTLWANTLDQPPTSTLNAPGGNTVSNMAVVPVTNGVVNAFATDVTHLVLDFYGYFAPVLPN